MPFTLGHFAGNQFMPQSRRLAVISKAAQSADVFTLSEVRKDHRPIDALLLFDDYTVGELSIAWKHDLFDRIDSGHRKVMRGGRRGAGLRGRDRRRRGPSRLVIWVALTEKATGRSFIIATHHAIAKADTQHKWRRRLRRSGFRKVVAELRLAGRKHPALPWLLTGDLNTIGGILAFVRAGLRRVKAPATYGRRLTYDRIYRRGRVALARVRTIRTKSDHRGLLADVTLEG